MRTTASGFSTDVRTMHDLYIPACEQIAQFKSRESQVANLNMLNDLGLALWFMDDGCQQRHKTSPHMKLALQRYSLKQRKHILEFFKSRYSERASLDSAGNLNMSSAMSKKFCNAIGFYVPEQLRYKLCYDAPDFDFSKCAEFGSVEGNVSTRVVAVAREFAKKRGHVKTSYCISVADNENFFTEYGVVANCKDTTGTYAAYIAQQEDIRERKLDKLFHDYVMRFAPVIKEMCTRGLRLDPAALARLKEKLAREKENYEHILATQFTARIGRDVNPRSPKQLQSALRDLGMRLPTKRKKGSDEHTETTDKKALVKLRKKYPNDEVLPALIGLSSANKQLSSYVDFEYDRRTERVHYSLDGCGTETGRWAGYNSGWGEGFNPQTVPKSVRNCFRADEGKLLVQIDLAQAESRFVAWEAPEPNLMAMLEEGRDVHKYVAGRIFRKPEEIVNKQERQLGKKSGHSANYSVGPRTFAESCLVEMNLYIDEYEAKRIIETYFEVFPGIRRRQENIRKELYLKRMLKTPIGRERHFFGRLDDATFREAYAYCPQSTIPDITNHLMLKLWELKEYLDVEFLLQVHDSLLLQVPPERVSEIEAVARDYASWHPKITLAGGDLIIPVDFEVGERWGNMEKL